MPKRDHRYLANSVFIVRQRGNFLSARIPLQRDSIAFPTALARSERLRVSFAVLFEGC
eukprot:SAG31_NODE_1436_length_8345_cov_32.360660_5_plen_58_part_00